MKNKARLDHPRLLVRVGDDAPGGIVPNCGIFVPAALYAVDVAKMMVMMSWTVLVDVRD